MQVRGQHGGQPLYVQMPVTSSAAASAAVGQSIQIVRSVDQPVAIRGQQFTSTIQQQPQQAQQQQLVLNSVKAGQPSLITLSPQQQQQQQQQQLQGQPQQVVLQANNTVLQPQPSGGGSAGNNGGVQNPTGARQVAIQLQEQQPSGQPSLMTAQAKVQVNNQAGVNQRIRQHRKQSLK